MCSRIFTMIYFLSVFAILQINKVYCEFDCDYKKDGFYSDEEFCHIYWRCNYGVSEEYECPAGTAWNHIESRCDWLDNVDCTRSSVSTTKVITTKKVATKKQQKEEYDDEYETTKKVTKKRTDRPVKTTTQPIDVTEDIIDNAFEDSFDGEAKPPKPKQTGPKSQASTGTGGSMCEAEGLYQLPDTGNCAGYYLCDDGKEKKMKCGEKQLFNTETSMCEDYQQVFCGSRPVNSAERNQCQYRRDGIYPDIERNCRVFYQCIKQNKIREAKCPNNLKFNSLTGRCDNPAKIVAPCGTFMTSSATDTFSLSFWLLLAIAFIGIRFA